VIEKDIERWIKETNDTHLSSLPKWRGLVWLLWRYREFRNLFYYRIKMEGRVITRILLEFAQLFYKPKDSLYIKTHSIGEGFFIQHGDCTGIGAQSVGKNFWVNQQVTVGYSNDNDRPIIGDNVHITAGAKVFGKITIGDNVIIGANAVVQKDVPSNCTVVGVPAYIIKRDGIKVKEPL
jgi:serine O-acetyltransferase